VHYRLVVSDVDGTLIDEDGRVNQQTLELIRLFRQKGGYMTIATGRMKDAVVPLAQAIGVNAPLILYNGSMIAEVDSTTCLMEKFLDEKLAAVSMGLAREIGVSMLLYCQGIAYTPQLTEAIDQHNQKEKVTCRLIDPSKDLLKEGLTKILYIADEHAIEMLEKKHNTVTSSCWNLIRSEANYLELLPQGASKGNALRVLGEMLQIPIEATVAVGDERNDISMIQAAGVGVAVENAHPKLKDYADVVTRHQRSRGVGELLQRILQGETG